jgi:hypothetical protein
MPPQNESPAYLGTARLEKVSCIAAVSNINHANQARRRHLVEKLHWLGPAPLAHFIGDIERGGDIDATLEVYASLPGALIRAYGGDKFAPKLWAVRP